MKFVVLSTLTLFWAAVSQDIAGESAAIMVGDKMGTLMSLKSSHFEDKMVAGAFADGKYKSMGATPCKDGKAGEYSCEKVDLRAFVTHGDMGSQSRAGNDIWGE